MIVSLKTRIFMRILLAAYILSPIDFFPGPIDDAVIGTIWLIILIGKKSKRIKNLRSK